uniref:unconventional myosin-VIIa-like isoform X2 n=1 Tax=Myxine glutinosa TaxID=7769 RepID=UPI00358F5089
MVVLQKGEHVWLDLQSGQEFYVPIGAEVKIAETTRVLLQDDEGQEHWLRKDQMGCVRSMHNSSVTGVEDMIHLGDLHEAGILHNLLLRYRAHLIYTYTGSILVAMNPYQVLPIYTMEEIERYLGHLMGELPAHIFAVAANMFNNLQRNITNQCCIISGESGAGKTESTKLILQFLATVSSRHSWLEQQILEANPILEAFGNAKTIKNDNSSRFGKYIEIHYTKRGAIEGARIEQYLLEKSRVCRQAAEERNYHMFYCMLLGLHADQKKSLGLGMPSEYNYLTMGSCTSCEGRNDVKEYANIRSAMKILNFTDGEHYDIAKLLAAILHLGNIEFEGIINRNLECCEIVSTSHLSWTCKILEVDEEHLQNCLTKKNMMVRRESVNTPLSKVQTEDNRDALVKTIYGLLFVWIVKKINETIFKPVSHNPKDTRHSIGLLDIFGFENFDNNSFEQFCINFANEKLQQFFVRYVFKLEQEVYEKEGINWKFLTFQDNQDILDVIGDKPLHLFSLLDEESRFPKGTDKTMLQKMVDQQHKDVNFIPPKNSHSMQYGIRHFAGVVMYDCKGFLEKNRDPLNTDLLQLVNSSKNSLLQLIFQENSGYDNVSTGGTLPFRKRAADTGTVARRKRPTLSGQFRTSLDKLMKTLRACEPWFVRCIKPNYFKKPMLFERELCIRQLRYSGMMQTIQIRRAGYPIRHTFSGFVDRYLALRPYAERQKKETPKTICSKILKSFLDEGSDWQLGNTMVFLKDMHNLLLEKERDRIMTHNALLIQRVIKGIVVRLWFLRLKRAAIVIQKNWKGKKEREAYLELQRGLTRLQALAYARLVAMRYHRIHRKVILLQARCRGVLARKRSRLSPNAAAIIIQAGVRGFLARRMGRKLRAKRAREEEAERYRKMEQESLQKRLGIEEARNEAERKHKEYLAELEKKDQEKEEAERAKQINMLDDMFHFLTNIDSDRPQPDDVLESVIQTDTVDEYPHDFEEEFTFPKFAAANFQGGQTHSYVRQLLRKPLLEHEKYSDSQAAKAVWLMILRFMGDMGDPRVNNTDPEMNSETEPIMKILINTLAREYKQEDVNDMEFGGQGHLTLEKQYLNNMQKLHYIVGQAILRPDLRDEIYCQICKQLINNPSPNSVARGWVLLSLYIGCIPPSKEFSEYLKNFLSAGPPNYAPYCAKRLRRTLLNGVRSQPPNYIEFQATKAKQPMVLSVTLADGRALAVLADSASTAHELISRVAEKLKTSDYFGFSIFITLYDKVSSLGGGRQHVMDLISQCEQRCCEYGGKEGTAPWRLLFRKEFFLPWHDPTIDKVSTDLIYTQIIHGLSYGEYQPDTDIERAALAAQHCYIQKGVGVTHPELFKILPEVIPEKQITKSKPLEYWMQKVESMLAEATYKVKNVDPQKIKENLVTFARVKWPIRFSRFFEIYKMSDSGITEVNLIAALDWQGLCLLDADENVSRKLTFPEIITVATERRGELQGQSLQISTLRGSELVLLSTSAAELHELLVMLLEGLKKRSRYVVALERSSRKVASDTSLLAYQKGDLIQLDGETGGDLDGVSWGHGINERTKSKGSFPTDAFFILPVLERPSSDILDLFTNTPEANCKRENTMKNKEMFYTLEEYSHEHFRLPAPGTVLGTISAAGRPRRKDHPWSCSREPIVQPLLKSLVLGENTAKDACQVFTAILKYAGDHPSRQTSSAMELVHQVFNPAARESSLRDEIYCQILKQLTNNGLKSSEARCLELLWICLGLFPPSSSLLPHVEKFLQSRQHITMTNRLKRIVRVGPRKYPPHHKEIIAAQEAIQKIDHVIIFPDESEQVFQVESTSKAKDLCEVIVKKFQIKSADGFSLFVKAQDKVLSMPNGEFFFDFLKGMEGFGPDGQGPREVSSTPQPYQVRFLRKTWINVVPGRDTVADCMFYYPQELPKFLRGYHVCKYENAVLLASLVLRVRIGDNHSQLSMVPRLLKELVPKDVLPQANADKWKKAIIVSYNKYNGKSSDEAKTAFLKLIYRWDTFGTAFFEVRQGSNSNLPEILRIAINKNGVTTMDPKTKDVIDVCPFNRIFRWNSGNTFFHLTIGGAINGRKLLCETSMGSKMDDLLTSYIDQLMATFKQQNQQL